MLALYIYSEIISFILDSNIDMNYEFATLIANILTAGGVTFAAGQVFVSKRQQRSQIEAHIVEIHTHFQQQMRDIQKAFPPEVNEKGWSPSSREERRAVRLYWYLVFDEWYTCKYLSNEKRLHSLWKGYRFGVLSALRKPAFSAEVQSMINEEAIFFGLGKEFCSEISNIQNEDS